MMRYIKDKRILFQAFRWHEIARSVVFALVVACVIALPVALVIANAVVVWFWRWTFWAWVIALVAAGFAVLWVRLIYAMLPGYRPNHKLDLTRRRTVESAVLGALFFLIALLITLLIVPTYM